MSQIDITSYAPIVIWTWLPFLTFFLFLNAFILPNFINNIKIIWKLKGIFLYQLFFSFYKIKKINKFIVLSDLKNLIKNNKKLWNK